jgi:hypothetical protein
MGGMCSTRGSDEKCIQYFGCWNVKGRDHSENLVKDGRIILEWFLGKLSRKLGTGFIWLRLRTSGGLL